MRLGVVTIAVLVLAVRLNSVSAVLAPTPTSGSLVEIRGNATVQATQTTYTTSFLRGCDPFQWETCARKIGSATLPCVCGIDVYKWLIGLACLFAMFATLVLLSLISYEKHVSPESKAEFEGDHQKFMADRLTEAKRQGYLRRLQVSGPLVVLGLSLIAGGIPISIIYLKLVILNYSYPMTVLGYVLLVAALLPTDTKSILMVTLGVVIGLLFFGAIYVERGYLLATKDIPYYYGIEGYKHYRTFADSSRGLLDIALAFYMLFHLWFSPIRKVLHRLWMIAGVKQLLMGITQSGTIVMKEAYSRTWTPLQWTSVSFGIVMGYLIGLLCLNPRFRHHVRDMLRTNSEAAAAAAGVAELISHQDPADVLALAQKSFLCVPADSLTREDMAENTPNPRLKALAIPAELGSVDAFMSHSWHDNAEAKWKRLQAWRQHFKECHDGKEPTFWIDKYCIDQTNITHSLACLPIWLSGCKQLVVFCGETYLERLWCVMELFVYLEFNFDDSHFEIHMLGDKESLVPIIQNFDVNQAHCFTEADTEQLREVMDAGGEVLKQKLVKFVQKKFIEGD